MVYILLIILVLQFVVSYYIFDKDLFSPSSILCEVFIISTIACIYNKSNWAVNLSLNTLLVIFVGNSVFIFISALIHYLKRNRKKRLEMKEEGLRKIEITKTKCIVLLLFYLIFVIIFIKVNLSVLNSYIKNGNSFSSAMNIYRNESINNTLNLSSWIDGFNNVFSVGTYALLYVFINNVIVDYKDKKNYILLICIIIYLFSSVFTAQRTTILLAFLYSLFVVYELLNRKYIFISKLNSKYIVLGLLVVVTFLTIFGITRQLFGRKDRNSALYNVTFYMGTSIESLDLFIKNPIKSQQFGEELFKRFRNFLSKYGICEKSINPNSFMEFRYSKNGIRVGNIYTGYREYIHDFGYGSIVFFQTILAIFYGVWYEKLNNRNLRSNVDISFIVYAWFILCIYRFTIMNSFFSYLATFVFYYWYIFLFWCLFLRLKIRWGNKYIA